MSRFSVAPLINYTIRSLIIVLGVLLFFGLVGPAQTDSQLNRVLGVVFILFGAYRIAMYYTAQKRSLREQEQERE